MKAVNIKWCIDEEETDWLPSLPTEIEIPDNIIDEDEISDYISNETGYCHYGYTLVK